MTSRRAALVAAVLLAPAAWIAGPASAQACQPNSAELALEELLDIAADGSPLEDQARRIANEQDARNAFESAETIRRIEELAHANDLAYDCKRRRYVPVQRPDPREAIANDQEPADEGPDGRTAPAVAPKPGATSGITSPSVVGTPGRPGSRPGTVAPEAGRPGNGSSTTDPGSGQVPVTDADSVGGPEADTAAGGAGARHRPGSGGSTAGGGDNVAVEAGAEDIAAPGEAQGTGVGAVAVVEPDGSGTGRMALGATAAAAIAGMLGALRARRRRHQAPPLA